jgi:hypothetical protein
MSAVLPIYGKDSKTVKPGMYLALFHGYKNEEERAKNDAWGVDGPLIGPLKYCHTTYGNCIKLGFKTDEDALLYGYHLGKDAFNDIPVTTGGCIKFQGIEYGDWTIAIFPEED